MEAEERVCYEFGFGPHAGLDAVVGFDVAIDCWKLARAKYIEVMGSGDCFAAFYEAHVGFLCFRTGQLPLLIRCPVLRGGIYVIAIAIECQQK